MKFLVEISGTFAHVTTALLPAARKFTVPPPLGSRSIHAAAMRSGPAARIPAFPLQQPWSIVAPVRR